MKSFFYITIFLLSLNTFAQKPQGRAGKPDFTPEQQAVIQSKRLTLVLDLYQNQTKQVETLLLKNNGIQIQHRKLKAERIDSGEYPTKEEMFEIKNKQLDAKLEFQRQMKEILNKEQYEQWRKIKKEQFFKKQNAPNKIPHHPGKPPRGFN